MQHEWFRPRGYRHLDLPISEGFLKKAIDPAFVSQHSFLPLLHYEKIEKRYKFNPENGLRTITEKSRPIRYASHRDACILSYYAHLLNFELSAFYTDRGITENVLAYRPLGRSTFDFAAEAFSFANEHSPVTILAFDVSRFFDTLDHQRLKHRLKTILKVSELSPDWYRILKFITRFHFVDLGELRKSPDFAPRLADRSRRLIANVEELKSAGVVFHPNPEITDGKRRGIPQGTPISAAASNLYMMDFDTKVQTHCSHVGALYRRYSDDILVICRREDAHATENFIGKLIQDELLEISVHKTERTDFDANNYAASSAKAAQYLGFDLRESGAAIRASSLSKQWRKLRRAVRKAKKTALSKARDGESLKVYTKKLYRRFTYLKYTDGETTRSVRNFSSYARRSAAAFGTTEKISRQSKRLERAAMRELALLKSLTT